MTESTPFEPKFDRPPVIETRISVQFSPFVGLQSGHFGMFWQECLGSKWRIQEDQPPAQKETETFGSKFLRPPGQLKEVDSPQVCMRLISVDDSKFVLFQSNRLTYGWKAANGRRPSYHEVKDHFVELYSKLGEFATKWSLGEPVADLWEVAYVNGIAPGALWKTPSDWHRVLPGLFSPGGPQVQGHNFATFNGVWIFEIPPQRGRIRARVQKVVANQSQEVLLLLVITARGEVGGTGVAHWMEGLDLGHQSALLLFHDLSSAEALKEWGVRS